MLPTTWTEIGEAERQARSHWEEASSAELSVGRTYRNRNCSYSFVVSARKAATIAASSYANVREQANKARSAAYDPWPDVSDGDPYSYLTYDSVMMGGDRLCLMLDGVPSLTVLARTAYDSIHQRHYVSSVLFLRKFDGQLQIRALTVNDRPVDRSHHG